MRITIAAVGKLKDKYLKDGIAEYVKRLSRFADVDLIEVEDEQAPDSLSPAQAEQVKQKEAERLLKRIKEGSYLVLLDVSGEQLSSEAFSNKLESIMLGGSSHITFIIGGSLGVDSSLIKAAQYRISLSRMTFPHQLARLILLEQIYRGFKIMRNEVYHK